MSRARPDAPIVVVGGTGFVGRAVADVARRHDVPVRWAVRRPEAFVARPGDEVVAIDLARPASIPPALAGAGSVLCLAHLVSGTRDDLVEVNAVGAQHLARAVEDEGVGALVRLGTASVHGRGPWPRRLPASPPTPASPTSATRLAGDDAVLEAGGTVVRPHLVLGPGDRWVLPRLAEIGARVGLVDEGAARHTVIEVHELAALLWRLVTDVSTPSGVVHAGRPEPVTSARLVERACRETGRPLRSPGFTLAEASTHPAGRDDARWEHDLALLTRDHVLPDPRL